MCGTFQEPAQANMFSHSSFGCVTGLLLDNRLVIHLLPVTLRKNMNLPDD